jgi:hypothetical protein
VATASLPTVEDLRMTEDARYGVDRPLEREIEELKFLVGTACSRAINLLMQPTPDPVELQDEMAFLGAKASRLAEVLSQADR